MRRYLTSLVCLLLASFMAHAADPVCKEYNTKTGLADSGWHATRAAACSALVGKTYAEITEQRVSAAILTAAISGSLCNGTNRQTLASGQVINGSFSVGFTDRTGTCPRDCEADNGKLSVQNYTVGWARSPTVNKADHVGASVYPNTLGAACINGCRSAFTDDPVKDAFRSSEPSPQGLYRMSVDYNMIQGNIACTAADSDKPFDPSRPDKLCPGTVGEVDGKPACVGDASNPLPSPSGPTSKEKTGDPEASANPTAGKKPSTGEGSGSDGPGRTPSAGNGGNTGGPKCASGGKCSPTGTDGDGDGDGTTEEPGEGKEQAACGAPGQPKCRIDETGTPSEVAGDQYDSKLDAYKTDSKDAADQIKGSGDGIYDSWIDLFAAPPLASCEGFEMPSVDGQSIGTIDPCSTVEGIRAAMAYLWALSGFWLCLGWVKAANN